MEFIAKLQNENADLVGENERLAKSNIQYEQLLAEHDEEIAGSHGLASTFGAKMASWEDGSRSVGGKLRSTAKVEAKLDQDMADLVEYVKWISGESQKLRERVRASERVISDLKSSGESSVESLMETLYLLKVK